MDRFRYNDNCKLTQSPNPDHRSQTMTTISIIANGFGVLSTLCFIASFQVKSNKGLYIIQSVANVFYGIQFYLLGAVGGIFNMAMQIVRNLLLCKKEDWTWLRHPAMAPLLCLPSLIYMKRSIRGVALSRAPEI